MPALPHDPSELSQVVPYLSGNNDLVEGEVLGGYMEISAPHESATITGRACGVPIANLSADDLGARVTTSLFPNMMLSIHPDYVNYFTRSGPLHLTGRSWSLSGCSTPTR
ncbi:MAG: hypothetical protein U0132_19760 [Gemmatimonadaceae bacterium]